MSEVYIRTDSATGLVTFIHRRPFDPINGLGETRDNLMKTGFFVSDFPEPITTVGKKAVAYYDHEKKKVYYKYEPTPQSERSRITMLEEALNSALILLGKTNMHSSEISMYSVASISEKDASNDKEKEGDQTDMMNGLAKYLATQIYLHKLDHDTVINTYPDIKDDIESYLNNMEIIPVIKKEDQE